ncbi:MAG TPA: hypothetical protein VFY30_06085 [Solirubrobacterales bacterium]|jgi:hypothetical protein|nr:hypothetical protein [Solirubrobacterales bacterium]
MPPNSTQNLNAKLSLTQTAQERSGDTGISLTPSPIQVSTPPNQIFSGHAQYRGGYHLSF